MGASTSAPKQGAHLQVIGAGQLTLSHLLTPDQQYPGLPRTGTASFAAALQILLNGPVYHGGTQILTSSDDAAIKSWIDVLAHTPYKTPTDRDFVMENLKEVTEGFIATADAPLGQFVEELMELYPEAKVICTVRDRDA